MYLNIRCLQCGTASKTPEELAGKRVKCPACGEPIQVARPAARSHPAPPKAAKPTDPMEVDFGGVEPGATLSSSVLNDALLQPAMPLGRPQEGSGNKTRLVIIGAVVATSATLVMLLVWAIVGAFSNSGSNAKGDVASAMHKAAGGSRPPAARPPQPPGASGDAPPSTPPMPNVVADDSNPFGNRPNLQCILRFRLLSYSGPGDPQAAAERALRQVRWIDPTCIKVDAPNNAIVIGVRVMAIDTRGAVASLEAAGFKLGGVTIRGMRAGGRG